MAFCSAMNFREIDGVPVTELAEYLFSGKSCQVIRIPSGVWKIGRYGFYNCRELEELWFSSDFTDLGSGAFTGCHKIRRMEVQMNSQESGLKEILSEVLGNIHIYHILRIVRVVLSLSGLDFRALVQLSQELLHIAIELQSY